MKKPTKISLYLLIAIGLIGSCIMVLCGYLLISGPVISSFKENGDPSGEPSFVIFNPFREKKSEAKAEKLLNLFKSGNCQKAVHGLNDKDYYTELCRKEYSHPLEDWKLSNRTDNGGLIKLYFRVKRTPGTEFIGELWINLENTDAGWQVVDIEAIY